MMAKIDSSGEFSRLLHLKDLSEGIIEQEIFAEPTELSDIAKRFGYLELKSLSMLLKITRVPNSPLVRITGSVCAELIQRCVITLEPITERIEEPVEALYGPEKACNIEISDTTVKEALPPEPFDGDVIDLGELAVQQLALVRDPYPRKRGAVIADIVPFRDTLNADNKTSGPFSVLNKWQKEQQ